MFGKFNSAEKPQSQSRGRASSARKSRYIKSWGALKGVQASSASTLDVSKVTLNMLPNMRNFSNYSRLLMRASLLDRSVFSNLSK
jgi:hypothetical protein